MYTFVTLADYKHPPLVVLSDETMTEQDGVVTIEAQLAEMMASGQRLKDWREASFPGEELADPVPVFMDQLTAMDRMQMIYQRYQAKQAARAAALKAEEDQLAAEQGEEDPPVKSSEDVKSSSGGKVVSEKT